MLNTNYVLGLVDGEGSFSVNISDARRRTKVDLKFSLKLRHQDKEILDALQIFFGCGRVYIQKDKRANHSLCYRFEVQSKKEIVEKIIPFFVENPPKLPSRKRDFELFNEIVTLVRQEYVDLEKVKCLKEQLHWGLAVYGKTVRAVGTSSSLQR